MGKKGLLPTHPPKQGSSSQPPASFCLAEGAKQAVFKELILPVQLAQMCEYLIPDLCSLPPELSEPTGRLLPWKQLLQRYCPS